MVENVAGTTFDRIAPTRDLFLSSESLQKKRKEKVKVRTKIIAKLSALHLVPSFK